MTELSSKELEEYNKLNSKETKKERQQSALKENMNYIMIALLSVMQVVLSCLNSVNGELQFVFPTTVWGWILLIAPKIAISVLGYMIWSNFFDKGKQNAYKTEDYQKAQQILTEIQGKSAKNIINVVNPKKWETDTKIKKGIKLTLSLAITTFVIGELIVGFNVASIIGSLISLLFSVFWGLQMMNDAEEMFSIGYLRYATLIKVQFDAQNKAQQEQKEEAHDEAQKEQTHTEEN